MERRTTWLLIAACVLLCEALLSIAGDLIFPSVETHRRARFSVIAVSAPYVTAIIGILLACFLDWALPAWSKRSWIIGIAYAMLGIVIFAMIIPGVAYYPEIGQARPAAVPNAIRMAIVAMFTYACLRARSFFSLNCCLGSAAFVILGLLLVREFFFGLSIALSPVESETKLYAERRNRPSGPPKFKHLRGASTNNHGSANREGPISAPIWIT